MMHALININNNNDDDDDDDDIKWVLIILGIGALNAFI